MMTPPVEFFFCRPPHRRRLESLTAHVGLGKLVAGIGGPCPTECAQEEVAAAAAAAGQPRRRRRTDGSWMGADSDTQLDADADAFARNGFLLCPGLLSGSLLERAGAAFARTQPAAREDWEQGIVAGQEKGGAGLAEGRGAAGTWHAPRYFDTPTILEQDDSFLEIVEEPRLLALASRIIGDDLHLFQIQARTYPANHRVPGFTEGAEWQGYVRPFLLGGLCFSHQLHVPGHHIFGANIYHYAMLPGRLAP